MFLGIVVNNTPDVLADFLNFKFSVVFAVPITVSLSVFVLHAVEAKLLQFLILHAGGYGNRPRTNSNPALLLGG